MTRRQVAGNTASVHSEVVKVDLHWLTSPIQRTSHGGVDVARRTPILALQSKLVTWPAMDEWCRELPYSCGWLVKLGLLSNPCLIAECFILRNDSGLDNGLVS